MQRLKGTILVVEEPLTIDEQFSSPLMRIQELICLIRTTFRTLYQERSERNFYGCSTCILGYVRVMSNLREVFQCLVL